MRTIRNHLDTPSDIACVGLLLSARISAAWTSRTISTVEVGVDLNLTDRLIDVGEARVFVPNPHFASAEAALAELLASPSSFYVNFHSDHCPGGVARGFLP